MQTEELVFSGAGTKTQHFSARFFRLMDSDRAVSLVFYKNGSKVASADSVLAGFAWPASGGDQEDVVFDRIEVTSEAAQTVKFAVSEKPVAYDRGAASVDVKSMPPNSGALVQSVFTASSSGAADALPANPSRRFLWIQNNDASAVLRVAFGVNATLSNSFQIAPGGSLMLDVFVPSNRVSLLGGKTAHDVVVGEG